MKKLFYNQILDKKGTKKIVSWFLENYGSTRTSQLIEELKTVGFHFATEAGLSLGFDDLKIPKKKAKILETAESQVFDSEQKFLQGKITAVERYQKFIDIWTTASETLKDEVIQNFQNTDLFNPLYMMAFSGARGNISQVRQLVGMRGLMSDSAGGIIDFPIRSNFREGLTVTEYVISCYGARKGLIDTALRTADSGYLTRRLVDVAHGIIIGRYECNTTESFDILPLKSSSDSVLLSLEKRIVGRVLAVDVPVVRHVDSMTTTKGPAPTVGPGGSNLWSAEQATTRTSGASQVARGSSTGSTVVVGLKNQEITPLLAQKIIRSLDRPGRHFVPQLGAVFDDSRGLVPAVIDQRSRASGGSISIRSPLTCRHFQDSREDICQLCYGWSLAHNRLVSLGEAVGIIAAQSIGEPGTQLTMRTFHTGGIFSTDIDAKLFAPHDGQVFFSKNLLGKKVRSFHGQSSFFTFEAIQMKIVAPPVRGSALDGTEYRDDREVHEAPREVHESDQRSKSSVFSLPPHSLLFVYPGQFVRKNFLCAEIAQLISAKSRSENLERIDSPPAGGFALNDPRVHGGAPIRPKVQIDPTRGFDLKTPSMTQGSKLASGDKSVKLSSTSHSVVDPRGQSPAADQRSKSDLTFSESPLDAGGQRAPKVIAVNGNFQEVEENGFEEQEVNQAKTKKVLSEIEGQVYFQQDIATSCSPSGGIKSNTPLGSGWREKSILTPKALWILQGKGIFNYGPFRSGDFISCMKRSPTIAQMTQQKHVVSDQRSNPTKGPMPSQERSYPALTAHSNRFSRRITSEDMIIGEGLAGHDFPRATMTVGPGAAAAGGTGPIWQFSSKSGKVFYFQINFDKFHLSTALPRHQTISPHLAATRGSVDPPRAKQGRAASADPTGPLVEVNEGEAARKVHVASGLLPGCFASTLTPPSNQAWIPVGYSFHTLHTSLQNDQRSILLNCGPSSIKDGTTRPTPKDPRGHSRPRIADARQSLNRLRNVSTSDALLRAMKLQVAWSLGDVGRAGSTPHSVRASAERPVGDKSQVVSKSLYSRAEPRLLKILQGTLQVTFDKHCKPEFIKRYNKDLWSPLFRVNWGTPVAGASQVARGNSMTIGPRVAQSSNAQGDNFLKKFCLNLEGFLTCPTGDIPDSPSARRATTREGAMTVGPLGPAARRSAIAAGVSQVLGGVSTTEENHLYARKATIGSSKYSHGELRVSMTQASTELDATWRSAQFPSVDDEDLREATLRYSPPAPTVGPRGAERGTGYTMMDSSVFGKDPRNTMTMTKGPSPGASTIPSTQLRKREFRKSLNICNNDLRIYARHTTTSGPSSAERRAGDVTQGSAKPRSVDKDGQGDESFKIGNFISIGETGKVREGARAEPPAGPATSCRPTTGLKTAQIIHRGTFGPPRHEVLGPQKLTFVFRQVYPYLLSKDSPMMVNHKDIVESRQLLFELFYQQSKTGDIVQGLPKIEQLFEARRTSVHVIETIHLRLKQKFDELCYSNSLYEAARLSIRFIQRILIDEIQLVYQSQGVDIADKHVEIIIRQMTSKVIIHEKGKSPFFPDDIVNFSEIEKFITGFVDHDQRSKVEPGAGAQATTRDDHEVHEAARRSAIAASASQVSSSAEHRAVHGFIESVGQETRDAPRSAGPSCPRIGLRFEPLVLGLTKVAFLTESFISAASFQESKRVLMGSALQSRVDFLYGLKENVVVGRFIRAGTGFRSSLFPHEMDQRSRASGDKANSTDSNDDT